MSTVRAPLAPDRFPDLPAIDGVRFAAHAAGVKYEGRADLMLAVMEPGTTAAGVFTKSKTASAPVDWCKEALKGGTARALIVNAGNANAFTGHAGIAAVKRSVEAVADVVGCRPGEVFAASTGVIGEKLPDERITAALGTLTEGLAPDRWQDAAEAIMTTDTFPKAAAATARIGGAPVKIAGIVKGSGMIAPDMATMLGFIFTDAAIPADLLQSMTLKAADETFNAITVDSDTSTSDTVMVFATGKAGNPTPIVGNGPSLTDFKRALQAVMRDLALQVVRDGEGAEKLITIDVTGAASKRAARRIGLAIANSPLVKTAIAGEDANWGRVVMAVGKAGEKADRDRLTIRMGGHNCAVDGQLAPDYDEGPLADHLKGREISIEVDVGVGRGKARVWTCDLTHRYIEINADYRS
ncbi:MAG: bifunctional glutamate N-acetyltransferase/amino-acid acetyltransferase ArgJ [Alphaproteobacteria bacterium]|nr:bifunctional glutamate N-acetyltransferase/amino-acid acetyltransferase ArgJ [Alphaproteobacteria bacterium]